MLTLEEDFEPVRTFVLLEVAVEPLVKIIDDRVEVSEVYMTKGQEMNISFIAEVAYPRPVFIWFISEGCLLQEKQLAKTIYISAVTHFTDFQQYRQKSHVQKIHLVSRMYHSFIVSYLGMLCSNYPSEALFLVLSTSVSE